jgi:hypothetical protein
MDWNVVDARSTADCAPAKDGGRDARGPTGRTLGNGEDARVANRTFLGLLLKSSPAAINLLPVSQRFALIVYYC